MSRVFIVVSVLVASLVVPAVAWSAPGDAVIADWRENGDGSIDGNYSIAELRAADAQISAEEREYFNWEEAYAAALARLTGSEPPLISDSKPRPKPVGDASVSSDTPTSSADAKKGTTSDDEPVEAEPASSDLDEDGEEDDSSTPIIIVLALLVLIAGVSVWRILRARRGSSGGDAA